MTTRSLVGTLLTLLFLAGSVHAAPIIGETSNWRYFKGQSEASTPIDAWRAVGFNDAGWLSGPATFYYGEARMGTELTDMQGGYSSVYFRNTFALGNAADVAALTLTVDSDDGFVAWINGVEVARFNMDPGDVPFDGVSQTAGEPTLSTYTIPNEGGLLQTGNNVLAVHGFNASIGGSSDFVFVATLDSILSETVPPVVESQSPPPGMVTALTQITVVFSESVAGVEAGDLLLNGMAATTVAGSGSSYTFGFPQPLYGTVTVSWASGHGIADLALPPNAFNANGPGASWQYNLVDLVPPTVASVTPSAGSTVAALGQIDVIFSEGVTGVGPGDLVINGDPATNVVVNSASFYSFQFPAQPIGVVTVEWATGHGIGDLAATPNAFPGGSWIYTLDPDAATTVVVISEFMASNDSTLADEDGDFTDWIEIFNAGNTSVDLLNWALTDNANDLNRWRFPSTNLPPGAFLLVFASQKDRALAGAELHANFGLSNGEYLGLVRPDGTIASEYAPTFPNQFRDVSYGLGFEVSSFTLVPANAPVRVLVPTSGALGESWRAAGFNDSSWTAGVNGVGFDTGQADPGENAYAPSVDLTAPLGYWRLDETSGTIAANRGTGGTGLNGTYVGGVTLAQPGPRPPTFGGLEANNNAPRFNGSSHSVSTSGGLLSNRDSFTIGGWVNPSATPGSRIGLFGQNDAVEFGFISGTTLQVWTPSGGSLDVTYPFPINTWHHIVVVGNGQSLRIFLDGNLAGTGGTTTANYGSSGSLFRMGGGGIFDATLNFFNGLIDEVVLYQRALSTEEVALLYTAGLNAPNTPLNDLIATDIGTAMRNVNSSAYIRIPFSVANPGIVDRLTLRVRYDDGFMAILNGQVAAAANSPVDPLWNSVATQQHPDFAAREYVQFDLPGLAGVLTSSDNVLAIHGLNGAVAGNDFLIQAELTATSIGALGTTPRYFQTPTPGAPNGEGSDDLGPIIGQVTHTPVVPTDDQDIVITAVVNSSFRPVTSVMLRWQVMYGAVNEVALADNGMNGDATAGDRIYTLVIPSSAATPGQMIRWQVRAQDSEGNMSRWPLFDDPLDSQEFLGTMVVDSSIQSRLPVMHLFVQNMAAAETRAGTRCSIFYLDEFYDNVDINLHGQSSAGFGKKSFDLDFPNDHRFLYRNGERRVKDIKWLTNWGDKSRVRNVLGYEFIERAGSMGHFAFQARIQHNGAFWRIADVIEDADDRWMERIGNDPNGALYKIYDNLGGVGSAEKKTRREEGSADLQALITSLNPATPLADRVTYAYDNINLPQAISYVTVCALISHQDHGHKNYYVYRDSNVSGEWSLIPWDIDLNWGRNWIDSGGYLTDPMYVDNVLDFYNLAQQNKGRNRFYDLIYTDPNFRAMYLRRLRTVMDTLLQPPGTTDGLVETRVREMMDLMDPPEVGISDADLDFTRWGSWGNNNPMRAAGERIITEHLPGRREFLFNNPNAALMGDRVPGPQPQNIEVKIGAIEFNPGSANQAQEYICLTNPNPFAVDISGWKIDGGVTFDFRPGTVMAPNGLLYVSPDVTAFRNRTTGPRRGQGLYVQGPYSGQLSARGEAVMVLDNFGRQVDAQAYPAAPSAAQLYLRVTELMYNPSPLSGNVNDPQNFEYIELRNISTTETLSLTGVRFADGVLFDFTGSAVTSLGPGQRVLVVKDMAAFTARYPGVAQIAGVYAGNLNNGGERLRLLDASGEEILDFDYNNSWYPITDGLGFSLVIVDENAEPDLWTRAAQWRASGQGQGSPGAVDPPPAVIAPVLINEALTRSETPPPTDSIELFNPNGTTVQIGDWYLSDDLGQPRKYRIPVGTSIGANSYRVFDESNFNPTPGVPPSFALGADGDEVYLFSANASGDLTGYITGFKFGAAENGVTFGRHRISTGADHFVAQNSSTLGGANSGPRIGPVVISEIHYHPADNPDGSDNSRDEFVELVNVTDGVASLFDPIFTTNTWELTDAVSFTFPTNFSLAASERILVVSFNPQAEPAVLSDFRTRLSINPSVRVLGPFQGALNNSGESVELKKPSTLPGLVRVKVLVDKVEYEDQSPWPPAADGFGLSLQRVNESGYGNDPANWVAVRLTPGAAHSPTGVQPTLTGPPQSQTVVAGTPATFSVNATGTAPLSYQWRFKGGVIAGATASVLTLPNVQLSDLGQYDVVVHNRSGSVVSPPAVLTVQLPAAILAQPQSMAVDPGTDVTLSVQAFGAGALSYQWFRNGIPLIGANSAILFLPSVDSSAVGTYVVDVTDSVGTLRSDPALLQLLIPPVIVVQPVGQTNGVGSTITFSVECTNTAILPIGYRWRKGGGTLVSRVLNSHVDFLTLPAVDLSDTASYSVVVTNQAFFTPGILSQIARLRVLAATDMDMDGLPDDYELANGLNQNDASDADADSDGDGFTNREEFEAGTDPQDPNSFLRVESVVATGDVLIRFRAVDSKTYSLQYRDAAGGGIWQTIAGVPATDASSLATRLVEVTDSTAPIGGQRYYRLVTPGMSE